MEEFDHAFDSESLWTTVFWSFFISFFVIGIAKAYINDARNNEIKRLKRLVNEDWDFIEEKYILQKQSKRYQNTYGRIWKVHPPISNYMKWRVSRIPKEQKAKWMMQIKKNQEQ